MCSSCPRRKSLRRIRGTTRMDRSVRWRTIERFPGPTRSRTRSSIHPCADLTRRHPKAGAKRATKVGRVVEAPPIGNLRDVEMAQLRPPQVRVRALEPLAKDHFADRFMLLENEVQV